MPTAQENLLRDQLILMFQWKLLLLQTKLQTKLPAVHPNSVVTELK
jgi:hypothetical protein